MLDDFLDALPAAANCRFRACHCFQVNAAQPLIGARQHKYRALPHGFGDVITTLPTVKANVIRNAKFCRKVSKSFPLRSVANNLASKIEATARQLRASVNKLLKPFERNKPSDADDHWRWVQCGRKPEREMLEIDPVVNPVNFRGRIRAALAKQLAAVIGFGRYKRRRGADFTLMQITELAAP